MAGQYSRVWEWRHRELTGSFGAAAASKNAALADRRSESFMVEVESEG
jgi:hypothetical protein